MSKWNIAKCPYCQNEMKNGFIEGDGRNGLVWVEENQNRNIIKKVFNKDCIVLEEVNLSHKTNVASNYCDNCKKIIIDIDK